MDKLEKLISQLLNLYQSNAAVTLDLPEYQAFQKLLYEFVFENHFEATPEWETIHNNLVITKNQHMVKAEANTILKQLDSLKCKLLARKYDQKWEWIHPRIIQSSQQLFFDGHYSESSRRAFVEINDRVKKLFSILNPSAKDIPDGTDAMQKVFSANSPMVAFSDISTLSGHNKQLGFMNMLSGSISAFRNPSSHSNAEELSEEDAYRRLTFASLLMHAIDEAVDYSKIKE